MPFFVNSASVQEAQLTVVWVKPFAIAAANGFRNLCGIPKTGAVGFNPATCIQQVGKGVTESNKIIGAQIEVKF